MPTMVASAIPFSSAAPMCTGAADADDQDHGGEDQILRFTVIHLRFNQYADPRGADHPVQQQRNAPITGTGMIWIAAASLPTQESRIAMIAAPPITRYCKPG